MGRGAHTQTHAHTHRYTHTHTHRGQSQLHSDNITSFNSAGEVRSLCQRSIIHFCIESKLSRVEAVDSGSEGAWQCGCVVVPTGEDGSRCGGDKVPEGPLIRSGGSTCISNSGMIIKEESAHTGVCVVGTGFGVPMAQGSIVSQNSTPSEAGQGAFRDIVVLWLGLVGWLV
eukprot:NODE_5383_length_663_cov_13.736940_g5220_i0.p1 GENE.NODE_5383_length_663_cov_13.736940_g5220_i0~~NODE_5383_length_663_cov_13.736940_g5220_i0.p1  ORF type:complete len:171 (+),score=8.08 NODE_5383_length_663_cov_13.736940_g5220_i0:82-594(+)